LVPFGYFEKKAIATLHYIVLQTKLSVIIASRAGEKD